MKFTNYGYRINTIKAASGPTWLFLPGGPGLGSEYLIPLSQQLVLPGTTLVVDFPKDGTNTQGELDFKKWQVGLVDLVKNVPQPILVTHSFAGMFVLSFPEIEKHLAGLVVMNTTSKNSFFEHVGEMHLKHNLPDLVPAASQYHLNPSQATYKEFWETYQYYCFTKEELSEGKKMIPLFAFNSASYLYAIQHFYADYSCKLQPTRIPVMTIAGQEDYICPPDIFVKDPWFQAENIVNKIIPKAGHCPWVIYQKETEQCFEEYIAKLRRDKVIS